MKLITRDTDYAIRAVCYIARNKERVVSVRDLVKELKMPRPFMRKLLQILHKKGILNSFKGHGGGFTLMTSPKEILLVDLIEAFQGQFELNKCIFKRSICPERSGCVLRQKINDIEKRVLIELKRITIDSLS